MDIKKEERTECFTMWVTPEVAKELAIAKDNVSLRDDIIKRFVAGEKSWLETEMVEIDEQTIRYRAKLLGIRDAFQKAQDGYVSEIEAIAAKATETFGKVSGFTKELSQHSERALSEVRKVSEAIGYVNVDRLEKLLALVERFNTMTSEEKKLITLLISGNK